MTPWQKYLDQNSDRFLQELLDFLRIPSVSALPNHAPDVQRAATWVAGRLEAAGIEDVRILPTGGHPVVYGEWLHAEGQPVILIYGHFDTQPADPLDLWATPPFEPVIRDGRLYARGATDDKGNMLLPILATETLLKTTGALPVNLKFFFEGQEEIGSPQIPAFIAAQRELLACDLVISADALQWTEEQPNLLIGTRGGAGVQIDIKGAKGDLHSGLYGGTIQNPLHALAALIASMHSPEGKVLVEDFYDDVVPLSLQDRKDIAAVPYDVAGYMAELGVKGLFGEPGYTTRERAWARPTLEVNGIWGGFQGEGVKTVLPNEAHAKITCRLVANQDPARIIRLLTAHVAQYTPPGVEVQVRPLAFLAHPYLMPADHPGNHIAAAVLEEVYGRPPIYTRLGGTLPVCALFLNELGAYTVSFGFCLEDENLHAPNEFFRLSSFYRGQQAYTMLLEKLAKF